MTAAKPMSRHPSAGSLLRRLDGELDAETAARLERHLVRCSACRERLAELDAQSRAAGGYVRTLAAGAVVDTARRGRARAAVRNAAVRRKAAVRVRRNWAAAAMVAGLLVVSMTVDPLRAWVLERLAIGSEGADRTATMVALPSAVVSGEGSVISFDHTGEVFEVQVVQPQQSGELFLQVLPIDRATAQITSPGGETMLVLPSGLRIENSAGSVASYRVTLPGGTERVRVRIADGPPRELAVDPGEGWNSRVPLAP